MQFHNAEETNMAKRTNPVTDAPISRRDAKVPKTSPTEPVTVKSAGESKGFVIPSPPKAEKSKFPKTIGACADKVYELRIARLAKQKEVDAIEADEQALKAYIIDNLPKSEASGVAGKYARVTVITKEVPQVKDWPTFYKFLKKTGDFDLLQKGLSKAAVEARWDAGKTIPGIEVFTAVTLSITKV
jgi:hypothetical protein